MLHLATESQLKVVKEEREMHEFSDARERQLKEQLKAAQDAHEIDAERAIQVELK